jgi:hypothetical protein
VPRVAAVTRVERFDRVEEERYLPMRLDTVGGERVAGQYAEDGGRLVYASLFAR